MQTKIADRLYVGNDESCRTRLPDWVVIHACKAPCHMIAVKGRYLDKRDPNYLFKREENDLYLNMVDPAIPLFFIETFQEFLQFAEIHYKAGKTLLIHCNMGQSRAPSLALLFLAKVLKIIPNTSYPDAYKCFLNFYKNYSPGAGIQRFLEKHWSELG